MKKAIDWHAPKFKRPCRAEGDKVISCYVDEKTMNKFIRLRKKYRFSNKPMLETIIKQFK